MLLLFAVPLYAAEEVYLKDLGNGNFAVSVREVAPQVAQSSYVTVTLPPTATSAPTKGADVLPGLAKVELDVWTGRARGDNSDGFYVGGRAAYRPFLTVFSSGAKAKVGPYVGINYWEGKNNNWRGDNTRYSLGISGNLAKEFWSTTAHIGVGYQESQGRDGRYRSRQYDVGPEVYLELNTKNLNEHWLKRRTLYAQAYAPIKTTQHNSWNGRSNPEKEYDNTRLVAGLYQDVYTTYESKSGYRGVFGLKGEVGQAYGNDDTFYSVGPYVRVMANGKDVIRVGFMNPEFHSAGERVIRLFDVSVSLGGLKELAK